MDPWNSFQSTVGFFTRTLTYLSRSRDEYADIEALKRDWARETLDSFGVSVDVHGAPETRGPLLMIGNHISYLDIPMLMMICPGVSFLAKSEIRSWPVIGYGANVIGTTFVKRENREERASAKAQIADSLKSGAQIALFPSGTTCVDESKPWKRGAFEIAKNQRVPIQPFRIHYSPLRTAAYIDADIFPVHLFQLARANGVKAIVEFHRPVPVEDVIDSCAQWHKWSQGLRGC